MTDLTPDAGPVELLTNAVVQLGGPGIWIMAMFIKTLMGAAAGTLFENPKDFLVKAFKPEEITPVALKMDVVVHGAVNMEMKWRACREPEIADNWQHLVDSGSCEVRTSTGVCFVWVCDDARLVCVFLESSQPAPPLQ